MSYRDPEIGTPRRKRFGMVSKVDAEIAYHEWVATHLRGESIVVKRIAGRRKFDEQLAAPRNDKQGTPSKVIAGSMLHVGSGFLTYEESRVRRESGLRFQGTIAKRTYEPRKSITQEFLRFWNSQYGEGAGASLQLADLTIQDVKAYNRILADSGYSDSQVTKRMQATCRRPRPLDPAKPSFVSIRTARYPRK